MPLLAYQIGDKVRLKSTSPRPGLLCSITAIEREYLVIRSREDGSVLRVKSDEITNFSLAARKAWKSMPKRKVGRPRGTSLSNRISVTLRIDRELWDQFKRAEASDIISDRTETMNRWLKEKLDSLTTKRNRAS